MEEKDQPIFHEKKKHIVADDLVMQGAMASAVMVLV